jgi:hypothetical protein
MRALRSRQAKKNRVRMTIGKNSASQVQINAISSSMSLRLMAQLG